MKKIGNTAFVFPVGDENTFFPVEISAPTSSSDAFMTTYFSKPQYIGSNLDSSLYRVSSCNYWKIERIVGASNVNVKLYWDSMGCGLFDTLNMTVANWDGSKWKNLGYSQILGDPNIGSIKNASSVNTYGYFSIAELKTSLAPSCSLGFTRSLPPDFFGFNGSNTIDVDQTLNTGIQTWADILAFNPPFVQDKKITLMRIPAGTLGNFSDWRTGWPKLEKDLPYNWDYDKFNYRKLNDGAGNELQDVANNLNLIGARPIFMWNVLTSKFLYEVASVYRAHEVNLPVKYIELGNEFYLEDEYYKQVFPSVGDYVSFVENLISDYNQLAIPGFNLIEWAVVGSDYSQASGGRRKLWTESLLNLLPSNTEVDAIVVHDYIGSGVPLDANTGCTDILANQSIKKYFNKIFKEGETLKATEINKLSLANSNKFLNNELEMWITEFNNLDYENAYIGTWAHGLFNVGMALKYLESEEITKVVSHTMASDGVFGNIFESECGFSGIKCHGTLPSTQCPSDFTTNKGEFTALGNALNQFALATKDAVTATQLDFSSDVLPIIINANEPLNPELYGWMFTKGNGDVEF
ncbi:MAG: hypothetical protein IPO63_08710 [Bacteroidetes bacterium]|nr:hypothetical protein [Bacteroidota bacterium]